MSCIPEVHASLLICIPELHADPLTCIPELHADLLTCIPELHAGGELDSCLSVSPVSWATAGNVQQAGDTPNLDTVQNTFSTSYLRLSIDAVQNMKLLEV